MANEGDVSAQPVDVRQVCPMCGNRGWTEMPQPLTLQQGDAPPGLGLTVEAAVCNNCGFVALMAGRS
jgi:predicted Zn-ribbon and HTH transcriptional regulator